MIYFQVSFNIKSRNQKKRGGARKTKAAGAYPQNGIFK